jgi:hypothetical protein
VANSGFTPMGSDSDGAPYQARSVAAHPTVAATDVLAARVASRCSSSDSTLDRIPTCVRAYRHLSFRFSV